MPTREEQILHRGSMSMFSDKLAGLVGPSYFIAFCVGGLKGAMMPLPKRAYRTTRLRLNTMMNNVGKTSFRYGNNTGAAVLLYLLTGKLINFIFLEEFDDLNLSEEVKNAVFGAAAGALYKSTRGFRPMVFGAFLGAVIGSGYAVMWKRDWMKLL